MRYFAVCVNIFALDVLSSKVINSSYCALDLPTILYILIVIIVNNFNSDAPGEVRTHALKEDQNLSLAP